MQKSLLFVPLFMLLSSMAVAGYNFDDPDNAEQTCPNDPGHRMIFKGKNPGGSFFPTNSQCGCPGQGPEAAPRKCTTKNGSTAYSVCPDPNVADPCASLDAALSNGSSSGKSNKPSASSMIEQCEQDKDEAVDHSCDLRKNASTSGVITMGQMLLKTMSSNPTLACSQFGDFSMAAQGGLLAYDQSCSSALSKCQDSCDTSAISDPTSSADGQQMAIYLKRCNQLANQVRPDYSVILQAAGFMQMQGTTCAAMKAALTNPQCVTNPMAVGCAGYSASDCTNPVNAGSATCQCILNPSKCSGVASGTGAASNSPFSGAGAAGMNAIGNSAGGVGGLGSAAMGGIGGLGDPATGPNSKNNAGGGPNGGGGGGGGTGLGTSPVNPKRGAPGQALAGGNKYQSLNAGVITNPGGGGGSAVPNRMGGAAGSKGVLGGNYIKPPDFNQYRPNMPYDPTRALAGKPSSGMYKDGITGPETDIWEKVRVQYSQQSIRGAFYLK